MQGSAWFRYLIRVAGLICLCVVSGLAGGFLTRHVGATDHAVSYSDFISILLTAISLLMTVLAIFLAVAGFIGWSTIEQKVQGRTQEFLTSGFAKGGQLDRMIVETIEKRTEEIMFEGVQSLSDDVSTSQSKSSERKDSM